MRECKMNKWAESKGTSQQAAARQVTAKSESFGESKSILYLLYPSDAEDENHVHHSLTYHLLN